MPILRITFVSLESLKYFFKSVSISLFSNFRLYKTCIINKRSHNCTQIADNQCECPCWQELWKNNSHQMWNSAKYLHIQCLIPMSNLYCFISYRIPHMSKHLMSKGLSLCERRTLWVYFFSQICYHNMCDFRFVKRSKNMFYRLMHVKWPGT